MVDVDHGPSPLSLQLDGHLGHARRTPNAASATLTCTKVGMVTVTLAASDGDPGLRLAAVGRRGLLGAAAPDSPIKHVIVLIGENRSFDHAFGTYVPKSGQTISNLLSKGIINADGTPGPNFAVSAQQQAAPQAAFWIAPDSKSPYATLPPPSTSGAPSAQRPTAPPFQTVDQASFETDIFPADIILMTTGATGLPGADGRHAHHQRRQPAERRRSS